MNNNKLNAFEAISQAQRITFYPIVFQSIIAAKRLGVLGFLSANKGFHSVEVISQDTGVSIYGVKILLDMLCKVQVVDRDENAHFALASVGFFLLHDKQSAINLDFVNDVCYKGAYYLKESIEEGKPIGLKELGDWQTIYEGLLDLPSDVSKSWFDFDHFYSDGIFSDCLDIVFSSPVFSIMDIGGNTGRFTLEACKINKDVKINTINCQEDIENLKI